MKDHPWHFALRAAALLFLLSVLLFEIIILTFPWDSIDIQEVVHCPTVHLIKLFLGQFLVVFGFVSFGFGVFYVCHAFGSFLGKYDVEQAWILPRQRKKGRAMTALTLPAPAGLTPAADRAGQVESLDSEDLEPAAPGEEIP